MSERCPKVHPARVVRDFGVTSYTAHGCTDAVRVRGVGDTAPPPSRPPPLRRTLEDPDAITAERACRRRTDPAHWCSAFPFPVRRGYAGADRESLVRPGLALHALVSDAGGVIVVTDRVVIARVAEVLVLVELG